MVQSAVGGMVAHSVDKIVFSSTAADIWRTGRIPMESDRTLPMVLW